MLMTIILITIRANREVLPIQVTDREANPFIVCYLCQGKEINLRSVLRRTTQDHRFENPIRNRVLPCNRRFTCRVMLYISSYKRSIRVNDLSCACVLVMPRKRRNTTLIEAHAYQRVVVLRGANSNNFLMPIDISNESLSILVGVAKRYRFIRCKVTHDVVSPIVLMPRAIYIEILTIVRIDLPRHPTVFNQVRRLRFIKVREDHRQNIGVSFRTTFAALLHNSSSSAINNAKTMSKDKDNVLRGLSKFSIISIRFIRAHLNERAICCMWQIVIIRYSRTSCTSYNNSTQVSIDKSIRAKSASLGDLCQIILILL